MPEDFTAYATSAGLVDSRRESKNYLIMRLVGDNREIQRIEALLDNQNGLSRRIVQIKMIDGVHHINPEAMKDVQTAYKTLESIRETEYPNQSVTIDVNYRGIEL